MHSKQQLVHFFIGRKDQPSDRIQGSWPSSPAIGRDGPMIIAVWLLPGHGPHR